MDVEALGFLPRFRALSEAACSWHLGPPEAAQRQGAVLHLATGWQQATALAQRPPARRPLQVVPRVCGGCGAFTRLPPHTGVYRHAHVRVHRPAACLLCGGGARPPPVPSLCAVHEAGARCAAPRWPGRTPPRSGTPPPASQGQRAQPRGTRRLGVPGTLAPSSSKHRHACHSSGTWGSESETTSPEHGPLPPARAPQPAPPPAPEAPRASRCSRSGTGARPGPRVEPVCFVTAVSPTLLGANYTPGKRPARPSLQQPPAQGVKGDAGPLAAQGRQEGRRS